MTESALRDEICRIGESLYARGYVHGTTGNISALLPDGRCLVTPTDACLGNLDPARLALVAPSGEQLGGDRASKTLTLHRRIYATGEAGCIVHTHSAHLVSLTLSGVWSADDVVPPITPYYVMKVGHVPLVPYHRPGDPRVADLVAHRIETFAARGAPIRAVMLERLGPVAWHATPGAASAVLEELEETARLWLTCSPKPSPLDAAQIEDLRQAFKARW